MLKNVFVLGTVMEVLGKKIVVYIVKEKQKGCGI